MDPNLSPAKGEFQKLIIENIRKETKDFKTFFFREGHGLQYEAGQFITLIDRSGLREIRRSYSIVSSPDLNEPLAVGVKRMDNGYFSRILFDRRKPGDILITSGVSGFFKLPENISSFKTIFFFAAGSGITPVLSLIKTVLHRYPGIKTYLIYSNSSRENTAYYPDLRQMEKQFADRLVIHFLFSSAADLRRARLNRELLLEFLTINSFHRKETLFYICGPESYMRLVIFLLMEEGFPKEHIKKEDFNPGNSKLNLRLPPDKNNYLIQLQWGEKEYHIPVNYPDTILQAAKKIKLNLPYSCETGKCGSCAAVCISGRVWLSNNEVLTDQDLSKGLILTCTGYPQSENVVLKID